VDRFMVVRVGHYVLSFWLDYRQTQKQIKLLPPVFPIVLYNGSEPWTAASALSDLLDPALALGDYGVEARYFPIIVNSYPLQRLLAEANTVSTLFIAEAHYDPALVVERLVELYDSGDAQAASLLANWFRQMEVNKRISQEDWVLLEKEYRSREELKSMIVEAILKREEMIRLKAEAEGEAKGKAEGEAKGKAERDRQIAQAMHAAGYPLAEIVRILALSEAEVERLLAGPDDTASTQA
jgi:hypothetical protein